MRRISLISVLGLLILYSLKGQVSAYKVGEKIDYIIHYGIINGGIGSLELYKDTLNGKEVWHSVLLTKTTGMADALFKVRDVYEAYIDPKTELPLKSVRNIHEGRYRKYNEVLFDHKSRSDSTILKSDLTGTHIAPPGIFDILSCFYWFRSHILPDINNLKKGETVTIFTWFTDELYPIILRYVGPDEVRIKAGKIKCYKFNPVTEAGRLFKTEEDVSFWFSADKNFLPVKIRFDIFVGAFSVEMVGYEGLVSPLEFKRK